MKTLSVITGNQGKFKEIKQYLDATAFAFKQVDIDLDEIQDIDPKKVIEHKVQEAIKLGYGNFILDDSALYINGMNNLPGPLVKWFLQEIGIEGIYKIACAMGNCSAAFETIIAYADEEKNIHYFTGRAEGTIVAPRGTHGFGATPIFQPKGCEKTYAEMEYEEKKQWGQRIRALEQLHTFLKAKNK
jgi:non-canonical purine NTP pyrophosphatase (RdgB/HAM1 family)